VIGDRQARVGRCVLRDEPDLGQLGRTGRRSAAEDLDRARRRGQHSGRQLQQRRLAGAVRADQPDDPAGGYVEGAVGQRVVPSVTLGQTHGLERGFGHVDSSVRVRMVVAMSAWMLSLSSPAARALSSQARSSSRSDSCAAND